MAAPTATERSAAAPPARSLRRRVLCAFCLTRRSRRLSGEDAIRGADATSRVGRQGRFSAQAQWPLNDGRSRGLSTLWRVAVVIAAQLRKELGGSQLFDDVSFKVERGDRVALSGPNGAGKTTLLRILSGETDHQGGELVFSKGTRVSLHDQRPPLQRGLTLREYVLSGAADLVASEGELRELEAAMAGGRHDPATLRRYAEAQARLEHAGGYAWRERAAAVVRNLGFTERDLDRSLDTFSGGELTRASLARALGGDPDLLLLDEPTNHLDVASLEWLEQELQSLDAGIILVAHDRWFLEAVTNAVLELAGGRSIYFAGPWHAWRLEKAARASAAGKAAGRLAEDIARLERFVERFRYKKSKARQAQAKLTQIGRLERERADVKGELDSLNPGRRTLGFDFLDPPRSGRTVVETRGLELQAGDKPLLRDVSIALERGEHVALVGPNGSGKTTLLETLLGRRDAVDGSLRLGHGVLPAYFSQHEVELEETGSVLDCAQKATGLKRPQAQNLLGRFLFSGWEEQDKAIVKLSGGERRRLALALVVASGANFLLLDEPTNHLDLESREALEAALEAFPGTILLVSHDRALVDAVAERTLAVDDGTVRSYDGGWADYVRRRDELAQPPPSAAAVRRKPKPVPAQQAQPNELERVEAEISERERAVAELERRLAADWSDVETLTAHRSARAELQALLARWEELFEQAQASP
jgi:ATP-binding cassette, subfamily F, member 3